MKVHSQIVQWSQILVEYPSKVKIESMEMHSEAKIYKSKPELRNSKYLKADNFYSLPWMPEVFSLASGEELQSE